jgi:hypothetical protein
MRRRLPRHLLVIGSMCLGITLLLTAIDGGRFFIKLTYSLAIGASCTLLVELVRALVVSFSEYRRRARGLPPDTDPARLGWRGVWPAAAVALLLGPSTGLSIGDFLTGGNSPSLWQLGSASSRLTLAMSVLGTLLAVAALSTLERLANARAQAQQAQRLAAENQLRLLQSQLEPHMLFNTLANLRVLIGLDPPQAQAMLDRLIAFLRTTLNASRQASQPLSTEFTHLADYLALMQMRMGARLQVALDLPAELSGIAVPPLLLQPLVENAVKHGLEPKVEGGRIEVRAHRDGNTLHLTVLDSGVGLHAPANSGSRFGLEQVRSRLATLYGSRASFSLQPAPEDGAVAHIQLPLS